MSHSLQVLFYDLRCLRRYAREHPFGFLAWLALVAFNVAFFATVLWFGAISVKIENAAEYQRNTILFQDEW